MDFCILGLTDLAIANKQGPQCENNSTYDLSTADYDQRWL